MPEDKMEQIGKIKIDLTKYPGEDLYCDGEIEDELLAITREYAEVEYRKIIEERKSWEILYHLSPLRENIVEWLPLNRAMKVLEGVYALTEIAPSEDFTDCQQYPALAQMFMEEFLAESEDFIFDAGMEDVLALLMDEGQ